MFARPLPWLIIRGFLCFVLLFWAATVSAVTAIEGWQTSLETAKGLAQEQQKRILVFFTAEWCKYCVKMRRQVLEEDSCKAYIEQKLIPVIIDADKERALVDSFKVTAFPTFLVLDPWGGVIETLQGDMPLATFLQALQKSEKLPDKLRPAEPEKE